MSGSQFDRLSLKESFRSAGLLEKSALCVSSWFGVGLMPVAPGTFGTLTGVPIVLLMSRTDGLYQALVLVIFGLVAAWSSGLSEKLLRRDDPPEVVLDEVSGFLLTFFLLPFSWLTLSLGFVLFRVFDIAKPFPIRRLDKRVKGGLGVVLDDLVAGFYANLSLRIIVFLLSK
jgi:phosphatidylglycerophosphatase A